MFDYKDPSGNSFDGNDRAKSVYQSTLADDYLAGATFPHSAFTVLEAFQGAAAAESTTASVEWEAFPLTAGQSNRTIDDQRLQFQDEYVEWRVEDRGPAGLVVSFTTEFPEYFEAFAEVGAAELRAAVANAMPNSNPTDVELFGPGLPPDQISAGDRRTRFRNFLPSNPWNNGAKGILCLTQRFNTRGALINLLVRCSKPQPNLDPSQVCAFVGGACGQLRSSDPRISVAVQNLALSGNVLSAADPAGVEIDDLRGRWSIQGSEIDIKTHKAGGAALWTVSRERHRARLIVPPGLELDGSAVTTGAQVSHVLFVVARVITVSATKVESRYRTGNESDLT